MVSGEEQRQRLVEVMLLATHCLECERVIVRDDNGVYRHTDGWHRCHPNSNNSYATTS